MGVHTKDRLILGNGNFPKGLRMEAMNNIFPEYYVLRVNQYDETKEPSTPREEWMRYLKVGYIDPDTKVPGLKEALERLNILKMTPEERKRYDNYRFNRHYDENMLNAARFVGKQEGLEEGEKIGLEKGKELGLVEGKELGLAEGKELGIAEQKLETARKMRSLGLDMETILKVTGLTEDEID